MSDQTVEHLVYTRAKYQEALSKHPEIEKNLPTYEEWVEFMLLSETMATGDADSVVDIKDINQFAAMVSHWHQNMLARLRNMLDIPVGTQVAIEDDRLPGKGVKVTLKGDGMKGFQAATLTAIAELSQFPFVVSMEEDSDAPQGN